MKVFLTTPDTRPLAERRGFLQISSALTLSAAAGRLLRAAPAVVPVAAVAAAPAAPPATSFYNNFKGMQLFDQEGRRLDTRRFAGRTVLVNFVFTGCSTVCPMQTRALAEMQRQLAPDVRARVRLLSVSLDPLNDTPQALKRFAQRSQADLSGWTFATGKPEDIERLADALKLFRPGPDARKPDDHNTALWLVDTKGNLRMRYSGNPPDVARLVREISTLTTLDPARKDKS